MHVLWVFAAVLELQICVWLVLPKEEGMCFSCRFWSLSMEIWVRDGSLTHGSGCHSVLITCERKRAILSPTRERLPSGPGGTPVMKLSVLTWKSTIPLESARYTVVLWESQQINMNFYTFLLLLAPAAFTFILAAIVCEVMCTDVCAAGLWEDCWRTSNNYCLYWGSSVPAQKLLVSNIQCFISLYPALCNTCKMLLNCIIDPLS